MVSLSAIALPVAWCVNAGSLITSSPRWSSPLDTTTPVAFTAGAALFLPFVPHAQMRWLPGLSHVPISDDPALVGRLMLDFVNEAEGARGLGVHLAPTAF